MLSIVWVVKLQHPWHKLQVPAEHVSDTKALAWLMLWVSWQEDGDQPVWQQLQVWLDAKG
jgi:hypothetical protein